MWVLLLLPLLPPGRGATSVGCDLCPFWGQVQLNVTLGANITLECPAAGAHLGRLHAVHWHFQAGTVGTAASVCSQNQGQPRCQPPYGDRAKLLAPNGTPGVLQLRGLRDGDAGTYSCLLLAEDDCACGEVALSLGAPCSTPGSGATPSGGAFSLSLPLLSLSLLTLLLPAKRWH